MKTNEPQPIEFLIVVYVPAMINVSRIYLEIWQLRWCRDVWHQEDIPDRKSTSS